MFFDIFFGFEREPDNMAVTLRRHELGFTCFNGSLMQAKRV